MKKFLTIFCLVAATILTASVTSKAQSYKNAIGGRFGVANGVTFKTSLGGNKMLDLIANVRSNKSYSAFRITGLYEINNAIKGAPGLGWYYGIGASLGNTKVKGIDTNYTYAAVDGVLGLDYKFAEAPINLSLDWKPSLVFGNDYVSGFDSSGLGLSVRFTF